MDGWWNFGHAQIGLGENKGRLAGQTRAVSISRGFLVDLAHKAGGPTLSAMRMECECVDAWCSVIRSSFSSTMSVVAPFSSKYQRFVCSRMFPLDKACIGGIFRDGISDNAGGRVAAA